MQRPAPYTPWMLATLLLVGVLAVPISHALQHGQFADASGAVASVEAHCDQCHQPYVAVVPELMVPVPGEMVAPLFAQHPLARPVALVATSQPRGPPASA